MDTVHHSRGYVMPPALRDVLTSDPEGNRWAGFEAAMAYARAGFRVLPIARGGKAPERRGPFRHGVSSATSNVEAIRDAWLFEPDANVGVAPGGRYVVADIDPRNGGSLEAAERAGVPVDGYRERSGGGGWHIPLTMPPGTRAIRSATIAPGVEVKARGAYVVSPHSRLDGGGWYHVEPGRDVWTWPTIPATWPLLPQLTEARPATAYGTIHVTDEDREAAREVIARLRASSDFGPGVAALLANDPDWPRHVPTAEDTTESGRDFHLALAASHFVRDHPRRAEIIAALLWSTGWPSDLHRTHPKSDPANYTARAVSAALGARESKDAARLDDIRTCIQRGHQAIDTASFVKQRAADFPVPDPPILPASGPAATPTPTSPATQTGCPSPPRTPRVLVGTSVDATMGHGEGIRRWLTGSVPPEYEREDGWRRVPVDDLSAIFGVGRKTIWRKLKALEAERVIAYDPKDGRSDKGPRRDSRARWIGGET